jgi:hypothetical protein
MAEKIPAAKKSVPEKKTFFDGPKGKPGRKPKPNAHVIGKDWKTVAVKMPAKDIKQLQDDAAKTDCDVGTIIRRALYASKKWPALKKVSDG